MDTTILDTRGLHCPLPVLKARKALKGIEVGAHLKILATDPASVIDFRAFCLETGHQLVKATEDEGIFTFVIRRVEKP